MYAINYNLETGRVLSATTEEFFAPGMILMEELPEGDISNYRIINNEYVYDPLPPTPEHPDEIELLQE